MGKITAPAFQFKPFSKKQKQLLTWWLPESGMNHHSGIICDGAVRAGKTVPMSLAFVMWSIACFHDQNFGMAGKSVGAFRRNVVAPLKRMLRSRGYRYEEHRSANMMEIWRGNSRNFYYIFGGKDERSQDFIQGITLAGLLLDEAALMPRSFVEQAESRCSVEGSKIWYNCNPAGPMHWLKTERIDKAEEQDLIHLHFLMDDNLSLSEDIKERYKKRFIGSPVFYRRYILGEWCAAEGVIYPMYEDAKEKRFETAVDDEGNHLPAEEYGMSIDYGTQNAFAALLWQRCGTVWHLTDEYRYSGRDTGKQKTDKEYADDLDDFIQKRIPENARKRIRQDGGLLTIVDPSAASFIAELRTHDGKYRIRKADNNVSDGIRDVATCMQTGRIKIADTCKGTIKEFAGYVWDDSAEEDRPVKVEDHCMDALRYFVRTKRLVKPIETYNSVFGG